MRNVTIFAAMLIGAAAANAAPAVWESNYGTTIVGGDDATVSGVALGFAFPIFGTSYNSVEASTNGFISFAPGNGAGCCSGASSDLVARSPRLAAQWFDIVGDVRLNTDVAGRAVFTWTGGEYAYGGTFTAQAQLFSDGRMILGFDGPSIPTGHSVLTGLSIGNGATDPGGRDLSGGSFSAGTTFYEVFSPGTFDLNQTNLFINPRAGGGFDVSSIAPAVTGVVPEPASWALLTVGFGLAGSVLRRRRDRGLAA